MSTHNAQEAKNIVRRYLKLDKWFEEDIGMIEKAIDLIVQAAADKARHDIGKAQPTRDLLQRCAQINPYGDAHNAAIRDEARAQIGQDKHPTHPYVRVPDALGCLTCGAHETHQIHAVPPATPLPPSVKLGEKTYYAETDDMQAIRVAAQHVCVRWNQVERGSPLDRAIRGLRKALGLPEMP